MSATFDDYDAAVRAFWQGRDLAAQKKAESGKTDSGTRGHVTGGLHLTALQELLASQFEPLKALGAEIEMSGMLPLPGYYRRTKEWDVVVRLNGELVAAIECKSQVGSFGNNFNNRTEEAIGNAIDLGRAYDAGLVGSIRPWLGFVFILEYSPRSTSPVKDRGRPRYTPDPIFNSSSYLDRYRILFERLVQEGHYDAACLMASAQGQGIYDEPADPVSTKNLTAAIAGRVAYFKGLA